MKTNFKVTALGISLFAMAIGFSAFKSAEKTLTRAENNKFAIQNWYFINGRPLSDAKTESAYNTTPTASCDAVVEVPCRISFDASSYLIPTSNTPLKNYLNAHPTVNDVLDDAVQKRSE